jgi:hypothetical protein
MLRHSLILILLTMLNACASSPATPGKEILDEETGNTVTVVAKPIVFARERTDVAAYARDYATLVAVEVDHAGTFKNYLLLYRWSTVDKRMLPKPDPSAGALRLLGERSTCCLWHPSRLHSAWAATCTCRGTAHRSFGLSR